MLVLERVAPKFALHFPGKGTAVGHDPNHVELSVWGVGVSM